MPPLIDVLSQLSNSERSDFASWLASLKRKEQEAVRSELRDTTIGRLQTILSVPPENRIALFAVKKNFLDDLNDEIEASGINDKLKAINEKLSEGIRSDWDEIRGRKKLKP